MVCVYLLYSSNFNITFENTTMNDVLQVFSLKLTNVILELVKISSEMVNEHADTEIMKLFKELDRNSKSEK